MFVHPEGSTKLQRGQIYRVHHVHDLYHLAGFHPHLFRDRKLFRGKRNRANYSGLTMPLPVRVCLPCLLYEKCTHDKFNKKAATRHLPNFSVWIWDSIRYLLVKDNILIWKEKRYCPLWCLIQDALFSSGSNNDAVHFHLSQRVRHACLSILTKNIHHRLPGKKPFSNFLLANVNFFPQHESFANVKI